MQGNETEPAPLPSSEAVLAAFLQPQSSLRIPYTTTGNHIMSNIESAFTSGFYRTQAGSLQSIAVAVTSGEVARSGELGKVVLNGRTIPAEAAIAAGMIDQTAADYIAKLGATDKPAPFTREDHKAPIEEEVKAPAATALEALGAFFISPTTHTKAAALAALEAHLVASGGTA
jgi:hypothetical protein